MTTPLLATKTYVPPPRPELVLRPRLIERLSEGLRRKLILISAPAGFGKTTLLAEWLSTLTPAPSLAGREERVSPFPGREGGQGVRSEPPSRNLPSKELRARAAWLSLDQGDDDPTRFWRYVIATLQTADSALGQAAQTALASPQPPALETLVTALINDIVSLPGPLILVLDDYHHIRSNAIHASLNFLLDHMPPPLHLVITTREDPPLALSLRRGRRESVEIRAADLRFTGAETDEFLNAVAGLGLSAEDVAALENRTEGWVVGLQMAALSLRERDPADKHAFVTAFAGDDRYIVDYLVEEVFQRQPPHIQDFLLRTSILERLCSPLCDAVLGAEVSSPANSQAILEHLERSNLFILPLDDRRHWYRYHHLFADLLRQRLYQSPPFASPASGGVAGLRRRASEWLEREGSIVEAVAQALAASDPDYAADLIERHVLDAFYRSETVLVCQWVQALPESLVRARPLLDAVYANALLLASSLSSDAAERRLQDAEKTLAAQAGERAAKPSIVTASPGDTPGQLGRFLVAGFIATFRAYLARFRGDPPQTVIDLSLQALASLPADELRFRSALACNLGLAYWSLGDEEAATRAFVTARQIGEQSHDLFNATAAVCFQARVAHQRGRLHEAAAICRSALSGFGEKRPIPYAGTLYVTLGAILLEWNELEEAERALDEALELVKLTAAVEQARCYIELARLSQTRGDWTGAMARLDRAERLWPAGVPLIAALRTRLRLAHLDLDAQQLDAMLGQPAPAGGDQYSPEQLTLVRALIARRRAPSAAAPADLQPIFRFLDRQNHLAEASGWTGWAIEILILQALAWQVEGDLPQAVACLGRALALAEPEGYVRIFVDEGEPLRALLRGSEIRDWKLEAYAQRLLASFEGLPSPISNLQSPTSNLQPPTSNFPRPAGASQPVLASGPGGGQPPTSNLQPLPVESLSPRELEVLRLVAAGASNPEIARQLVVTVNTVKKHVTNIFGKLGATSRTQAVARARQLGLVD
jgi:LuxR family maltose regulon positive regulatory protein